MAGAANENRLDVRGMPAPDNILAVLKAVTGLSNGAGLEVCLDLNPFQLYDLLQQRGYFIDLVLQPDGTYRGRVKQREIEALSH